MFDWPVGAAGFETLHLEIRSAELHPASMGFRRRSGAPLIRDAQVRVPPPELRVLANSDSNMQRIESRRPKRTVLLKRIRNRVALETPRYGRRFADKHLVSVCGNGGREFLVHPFELLGRICADRIAGLRRVDPKL